MERFIVVLILIASISICQIVAYFIYAKTKKKWLGLLPTLALLIIGIIIILVAYFVARHEPDAWIGMAMIILAMVLFFTILASTIVSFILFYLIDYCQKKRKKVDSSSTL